MIHVHSVTNAVYLVLSSDSTLVDSQFTIELNEPLNTDFNRLPSVNIIDVGAEAESGRVARGTRFDVTYDVRLYVTAGHWGTQREGKQHVDEAVTAVVTAINSQNTLLNTVHTFESVNIRPFERALSEDEREQMLVEEVQFLFKAFSE